MKRVIQKRNRRGQVWVETVLYTLIGLALIGGVLAIVKPKIDSYKDKLVIEQTIESLNIVDEKLSALLRAPGNTRIVDLRVSKGDLVFSYAQPGVIAVEENLTGITNDIIWTLDSRYKYSEPGFPITIGNLEIITEGTGPWKVKVIAHYKTNLKFVKYKSSPPGYTDNTNLGEESVEVLLIPASPTDYKLAFINYGSQEIGSSGEYWPPYISVYIPD